MTATAEAGVAATPMTEEQKFIFDLKGWVLLPGVLEPELIRAIDEHIETLATKPDALPVHLRSSYSGPAQELLDHPSILGILREVLIAPDTTPDCYGFRCENSFPMYRPFGEDGLYAHGGGPATHPLFNYFVREGRIFAGTTRVIWELRDVAKTDGGTLIMSGTHKSNFHVPKSVSGKDSPLWETYECPAGSALIFSEALCHAGPVWKNSRYPRLGIFNCYNRLESQYHKLTVPPEVIDALSPKRRTLFRGVWGAELPIGNMNDHFSNANRAL